MGDKATIGFLNADGEEVARVYIHNSGSRADELLSLFFADQVRAVEVGQSQRFTDPSYLAARFVRWHMSPDGQGVGILNPEMVVVGATHWTVTCPAEWTLEAGLPLAVVQVYPPPLDTANDFLFGADGTGTICPTLPVGCMDRAKALRAAAWLSFIADPQGDDFAAVLDAIKST